MNKQVFYQMYKVSQSFLTDVEFCIRGHGLRLEDPGLTQGCEKSVNRGS